MGLRDDVQAALTEAMNSEDDLADVVSLFILTRETPGVYDPATDTDTGTETEWESRGIFQAEENINADGVKTVFESIIVNAVDLDTIPLQDDRIAVSYGDVYVVDSVVPVMGGDSLAVVFQINIRRNVGG